MGAVSDAVHSIGEATGINDVVDAVYNPVSDAVHWAGEVTGLDKIGDAIGDSPVAKAVLTAVAAYYGMPYLTQYMGLGAAGANTAAAQAAAWEASAGASMGMSTAEIAANLAATGMSQTAAMQAATMAAAGATESMIASTLANGANAAAQVAYARDAASMGFTEAEISADLVSMGMSNNAAGMLAADAASGTGMQALLASYAPSVASDSFASSALDELTKLGTDQLKDPNTWVSTLNNVANVASGAYLANESSNLFRDLANQSAALGQEYANKIGAAGADAASKAQFKPYTVTSGVGSTSVTPEGISSNLSHLMQQQQQGMFNASRDYIGRASPFLDQSSQYARTASGMNPLSALQNNAAQNMQDQALQQYATQAAMTNPNVSASGLFDMIQSTRNPVNARDRLALEQRLAAQGRLGTATAAYGGTPEQLALAIAQQEQLSKDALNAQLNAATLTGQNYGNLQNAMGMQFANRNQNLGYAGGLQDLQTAQQSLAANAANIGSGLFSMGNTAFNTGMGVFDQARADANLGLNAQGRAQDVASMQAEIAYKTALAQAAAALEGQKTAMGYNTMGNMQNLGMMQGLIGQGANGTNNLINTASGLFDLGKEVYSLF